MVYGSEDRDASNATPDLSKMLSMGDGFTSYSTATTAVPDAAAPSASVLAGAATDGVGAAAAAPAAISSMVGGDVRAAAQRLSIGGDGGGGSGSGDDESRVSSAPVSDGAADELVDLLLSADGNYVQELLLEEAAKLADAAVRDTIAATGEAAPLTTLRDVLRAPKRLADSTIGKLPLPDFVRSGLDAALFPANVLRP